MIAALKRTCLIVAVLVLTGCSAPRPDASSGRPSGDDPVASPADVGRINPAATLAAPPDPETITWTATPAIAGAFAGARVGPIAAGPAGIVALGSDPAGVALIAWTSPNGIDWDRHWLPPTTFGGGIPARLVATDTAGYVAIAYDVAVDGSLDQVVWSSRDGITWEADPDVTGRLPGIVSVAVGGPAGIILVENPPNRSTIVLVSIDGRHWVPSVMPNHGEIGGAAAGVEGFVGWGGVTTPLADGTVAYRTAIWRSSTGSGWTEIPIADRLVRDDLQGWHAGGGHSYIAGSSDWTQVGPDGSTAKAAPIPDGMAVGDGPAGIVAVALPGADPCPHASLAVGDRWIPTHAATGAACHAPAAMNLNRIVPLADGWLVLGQADAPTRSFGWLLRPGPSAEVAVGRVSGDPPSPPAEVVAPPDAVTFARPARCPAEPIDADTIAALDPADRVGCFGSRELTFRAWVVDPGEGYGGACAVMTPEWLEDCVLPTWLLASSADTAVPTAALHAMRRPDAEGDLVGMGRWVRVTGHFDDPEAAMCNSGVAVGFVDEIAPIASLIRTCRTQFAVTRMVNAP